ncbi:hypothetical protein AGMMS49938_08910 [Fibrobacterales bacterium]|nr:hypothetical protein AGMMS49938_08910 [Fibrobacterales bacterium]
MTKTKGLFLAVAFASISFISCGEEEVVFCNIPSKNTCEQKTSKECMSLVNNGLAQIVPNCDAAQEQKFEFEKESNKPDKKVVNKITEKMKEQAQAAAAQKTADSAAKKVSDSIAKHVDSLSKLQAKVGDFFASGSRHSSIAKSKELTLIAKSSLGGYLILDYMGNEKYRLATWNSKQKMSDKPSLSINGFKAASHNQGGISYDYKDKDGEVSIMGSIMSPNGWSIEFKLKGITPEQIKITPLYYVGMDEDWGDED